MDIMTILITALVAATLTLLAVVIVAGTMGQETKIKYEVETLYSVADEQFRRSMGNLLPPPMRDGNAVTTLVNGAEIFPAMLAAIAAARRTICFETFIYWSGEIGRAFVDALCARAWAGVQVHVLIDWLGSQSIDQRYIAELKEAGAHGALYHPLRWYNAWRVNHRTHRKLLIVDGRIGFTGGVGIADDWDGNASDAEHWRDNHYQLQGPCVAQMQSAFMDNWIKTHSRVLHGEEYFPELERAGLCVTQLFFSSPQGGSESVRLMYLMSIACARKSIRISSAYFVPDDLAVKSLVEAAKRGVRVEIVVPGPRIDRQVVRRASRARWGPLLEAGICIYEYQPSMYHCKLLLVDDLWVSVGSTNFDNRSFRLNDEANLNVLDADFALEQRKLFEHDRSVSRAITLDQWQRRPLSERIVERAAALLRSQL
jgi:cardiolipin synthase A/B